MKTLVQKQWALTIAVVFVLMLIAGCEDQNKNQPQTNVEVKQARLIVSENVQLRKQLTLAQDKNKNSDSEKIQLQKQLTQSQNELKKSVAETAKYSAEFAKCSADIAKCSEELTAQKEMAAEYEKQLNATPEAKKENARSEQLDSMLTMVIDANKMLTQENEKLKEQVDKLTKELEEAKKLPTEPTPLK
ncbi:MAG: hypothetical protein NTW55_08410 [Planctomycetota bacterium]|nr:hypothetical protein [Planctomycetota bacterium]